MEVKFREFNPFNLWIWLEFETAPSPMEKQYVEELFDSWFYLGKLGGFNAENFQVTETGVDLSYMEYDTEAASQAFMAPMHNMGDFEYQALWGRCWFDLGTSDPVALDVLINALLQLSKDYIPIKQVIVGGENQDWPVDAQSRSLFYENQQN
ncbi:MAG: DUF3531 domain-containing protein [Cyanobacteria bacterium QS_9_48_30]|nr:MAG: DUF3531 domain-containing protein [Cyanobacteria bacterium QS_9_48_30]